ncbi:hypothetical protein GUJ93_ZPchr0001g31856 [Zizania palustris]|uniref:Uncharacterized protein n=1 Tax=Zizania palustris TaxID=103762 RepID=A0A8J5R557_ZIZPA|nr:hypothetical protein GUJ93_ZPchr0001g31856 [Zizania palustris]
MTSRAGELKRCPPKTTGLTEVAALRIRGSKSWGSALSPQTLQNSNENGDGFIDPPDNFDHFYLQGFVMGAKLIGL